MERTILLKYRFKNNFVPVILFIIYFEPSK